MGQEPEKNNAKIDIEEKIVSHFTMIKNLCEDGISITGKKGNSTAADISRASQLTDQIFRLNENIRDLLFELEDTL